MFTVSLFSGIRDAGFWIRDKAIQEGFWRLVISKKTKAVKNMKNLEIDSKKKTFSVKFELPGENDPLTVTGGYRIVMNDGKPSFAPTDDIKTSKEWLTILAAEFLKGRTFEIPGIVGKFL